MISAKKLIYKIVQKMSSNYTAMKNYVDTADTALNTRIDNINAMSKGDFKTLSLTISSVNARSSKSSTISNATLASAGISNIDDWEVIGFSTVNSQFPTSRHYHQKFGYYNSQLGYNPTLEDNVGTGSSGLTVSVYNQTANSANISVRILLAKATAFA